MLKDGHFMSIADRSILACWCVKGGRAGRPFHVTIDPGGPNERDVDALVDAEPVTAGEVIRIRTTGGGAGATPWLATPRPWFATCAGTKSRPRPRCTTTAASSPDRSTTTRSRTTRWPPRPNG